MPLGKKPVIPNTHPLLEHRLLAARNGWTQNPCTLKAKTCKGWNKLPCDEAAILTRKEWRDPYFAGTAVRVVGELAAYDSDITIPEVAATVLDDLFGLDPKGYNDAIMRDSGGVTKALFWRHTTKPFAHYSTHRYTAHPDGLEAWHDAHRMPERTEEEHLAKMKMVRETSLALEPQRVEIYGPQSTARYFQYEGPHSEGREYRCGDRAPWNTRVDELPLLPIEPAPLIDRADAIMGAMLTRIPQPDTFAGEVVYDLLPEQEFFLHDGSHETLADLQARLGLGAENGVRGCMSALARAASRSRANCNCFVSTRGRLVITDWSNNGVMHYMESDAPLPPLELDEQTIAVLRALRDNAEGTAGVAETIARVASIAAERRARPLDDVPITDDRVATYRRTLQYLHDEMAYCAKALKSGEGAFSIYPGGEHHREPISIKSLRGDLLPWSYLQRGPRGGRPHRVHPLDEWLTSQERVHVGGVRLRPELPRPLFREDGVLYVNIYAPPDHPTEGGSIDDFVTFFDGFIPDDDERCWMWNWLACKLQHPHWRMVTPALVAHETTGTGRGRFAMIIGKLLGQQFVRSIKYAQISGGDGSRFNSDLVNALLVFVNESRGPDERKFHQRNAAKEAIKEYFDPDHEQLVRIEAKGRDAYWTRIATSGMVFSNHIDGVPTDATERRLVTIMNGPQLTPAERVRLITWMDNPSNIGALYRHLRDFRIEADTAVFDAHMARRFRGADLMVDASKTALEHAWEEALEKLERAADLYAMSQIVLLTKYHLRSVRSMDIDDLIERHTQIHGHRIGRIQGRNWLVRYRGQKERVYSFSAAAAKRWTEATPDAIRAQLDKAQRAVEAPGKAANKLITGIVSAVDDERGGDA